MGEKAMVESHISDAIDLIRQLDSEGTGPSFAMWLFHDDTATWELLLAGPFFDALLPHQEIRAYRKIVDAMAMISPSSLTLSAIRLIQTRSAIPQAVASLVTTPPDGFRRMHYSNIVLSGIFMKEIFVIRCA
jgi:hypothetical protein